MVIKERRILMRIGYMRSDSKMLKEEKEQLEKENLDEILIVDKNNLSQLMQFKQSVEIFEECTLVVYSESSILSDALLTDIFQVLD